MTMVAREFWKQFQDFSWNHASTGSARALRFKLNHITVYVLPASTEIPNADLETKCGPEISYARSHFSNKARQQEFLRGRFLLKELLEIPSSQLTSIGEHGAVKTTRTTNAKVTLTHKWGHNAIAVGEACGNHKALGIDLEHTQIKPALLKKIAHHDEFTVLKQAAIPLEDITALIFSAKESAYKACYNAEQKIRTWMDFKVTKAQDQRLDLLDITTHTTLNIHYRYLELKDSLANTHTPSLTHHKYILTLACL